MVCLRLVDSRQAEPAGQSNTTAIGAGGGSGGPVGLGSGATIGSAAAAAAGGVTVFRVAPEPAQATANAAISTDRLTPAPSSSRW